MSNKNRNIRSAVTAAFLAVSAVSNVAFAVYEIEPNDPAITAAQPLVIGSGGSVEVSAELGNGPSGPNDLDFFSFHGTVGNVITITAVGGGSLDPYIALFGPARQWLIEDDDSGGDLNARIANFRLDETGTYTVGVSSYPRYFINGGILSDTSLGLSPHGTYTLAMSGLTPPVAGPAPVPVPTPPSVQHISIEIKPGSGQLTPINAKAKGTIPVALLSNAEFDALQVNRHSITFGKAGGEAPSVRCDKGGRDVNGDGRLDLVCHFDNEATGFQPGDLAGIVKGRTVTDAPFEGVGSLKAIPFKRQQFRRQK